MKQKEESSRQDPWESLKNQLEKQTSLQNEIISQIHASQTILSDSLKLLENNFQMLMEEVKEIKNLQNQKKELPQLSNQEDVGHENAPRTIGSPIHYVGEGQAHEFMPTTNSRNNPNDWSMGKGIYHKFLELEVPIFNGTEDVMVWTKQIEQVFQYYEIPEYEWVSTCALYLKQQALHWFRCLEKQVKDYKNWQKFKEEVIFRFGTEEMLKPFVAFTKLKQTGSVREYLCKFERVVVLLENLPSKYILEKFVDGLKGDIKFDVLAARPSEFTQAVFLAKIFEEKLLKVRRSYPDYDPSNCQN